MLRLLTVPIDATNITTVTGTLAEVGAVYASGGIVAGISNLGNEAITYLIQVHLMQTYLTKLTV